MSTLDTLADPLRALLAAQPVAALGTLDRGDPFVSMVPWAREPGTPNLLIHVSGLSAHTRHMQAHPRVSLMVTAPLAPGASPLSLPRVTVQGDAEPIDEDDAPYAAARAAYLARFPDAEQTFALADFALVRIVPASVRLVAGFGRAHSFTAAQFGQLLG
jgi:hypothetical protein